VYVHSPKDQTVQLIAQGTGLTRLWLEQKIMGREVAGQPLQQPLPLKAGWNGLILEVRRDQQPPRLTLQVQGENLRVASRPLDLPANPNPSGR
jgi:hypothetical protein